MRMMIRLDITVPKHHLMYHVLDRAEFLGNPWDYTTFEDEGLNKVLKKSLRLCHQMAFENMTFVKVQAALERTPAKRPRYS
jgi:hypothetical protein